MLADFDGTICLHDVGVCLLNQFGDPDWTAIGQAYERGDRTYRELLTEENAMLEGTREEMLAFVQGHCPIDPTFAPFMGWLRERGIPITVISDGSAFHIEPMLAAIGLPEVPVITNWFVFGPDQRFAALAFPNAHPECIGCGTCKMLAVKNARRPFPMLGADGTLALEDLYTAYGFLSTPTGFGCLGRASRSGVVNVSQGGGIFPVLCAAE